MIPPANFRRFQGGSSMYQGRFILVWIFIFSYFSSFGQGEIDSGIITGLVKSTTGKAIEAAHVIISDTLATYTAQDGSFTFRDLIADEYRLSASYIGYKTSEKLVRIESSDPVTTELVLEAEAITLEEVAVSGKSEARALRESVATVQVLEVKDLYTQSVNTSDIIKQISGVNVRQSGGFGSNAEIYINGMSGKQVKLFLDGIPLSYFGSGLGLNVLPIHIMKQIEVYKGVVPVHLGADALGGAINVLPRKEYHDYLDASYSIGSFNSHKGNLNGQLVNRKKQFFIGLNSFFNHSDNNYKVDIEIPNEFGNPQPATVERFHDQFSNYLINVQAGVFEKNYADRLTISARVSGLDDQLQHNAIMAQPYGEVSYRETTHGASLEYEKQELLPNVDFKWYGGLNHTIGNFIDTTLNAYTWDGKVYLRRTDGGEISASRNLLKLESDNAVSRLNIQFDPWTSGSITLNVFSSWFKRVGNDPIAAQFYGQDYYTYPTRLSKNAVGASYHHSFSERLESYTALKYFAYDASGYAIQNLEFQPNEQQVTNFGYSQSFRYHFNDQLLTKASYEYATRLPDEIELFGDFTLIRPNPFLEPEQSHNINIGGQFNTEKWSVDVNGFFRISENIIWLRTSQFFAQYQNLLKASIRGFDVEARYRPFQYLRLKINATLQDIRNRSPKNITGSVDDRYFNARLPNIPYLFGNAEVRYQKNDFLQTNRTLSAWWSAGYVHEFYLFWAVDGNRDLKNSIPSQFIQNLGISFSDDDNRFSVTLESFNVLDEKAFDNFNVQRPGRSFNLTLRTYLKK